MQLQPASTVPARTRGGVTESNVPSKCLAASAGRSYVIAAQRLDRSVYSVDSSEFSVAVQLQ